MSGQSEPPTEIEKRRKSRRILWVRLVIFVAGLLSIGACVAFNVINPTNGVIALTALAILVALFQYVIPLPSTPSDSPDIKATVQQQATPLPPTILETQQAANAIAWNVPYRRNLYFTGREDVLQRLQERINSVKSAALTQTQAINGLGGVGKTQVAIEFAYRSRDAYRAVLWVDASTRDSIIKSYSELATLLDIPEQQEYDQNIVTTAVKRWFIMHDHWLLIFDNADDLTLAAEFLPTSDTGSLLLTTCNQSPGGLAEGLDITTMDNDEGTLFVLRRAKLIENDKPLTQALLHDRAQAARIVEAMDGLPLALDQASAYIEETQCTLHAFLEIYQRQRDKILRRRGGTGHEHPLPVAATLSLSFSKAKRLNPIAADLLCVCAFLAPVSIPEEMLIAGATELGPLLVQLAYNATQLDEAISTLNRFSLVRRNREDRTFSIHRLIQSIQLIDMDESTQKMWAERTVRAMNYAFPDDTAMSYTSLDSGEMLEKRRKRERYLPHALACASLINKHHLEFPEAADLLNETALCLQILARYKDAEPLYLRALAIWNQTAVSTHQDMANIANCLYNLALLYRNQDKHEQAEPLFQRVLLIWEQIHAPDYPEKDDCLNNLAALFRNQGKYEQAELHYKRLLAIREKESVFGPDAPETATCLNNLAELYKIQSKYEQAEPLYLRALAISVVTSGPNTFAVASIYHNLAILYLKQERFEDAESYYYQANHIWEKIYSSDPEAMEIIRVNYLGFLDKVNQGKKEKVEGVS